RSGWRHSCCRTHRERNQNQRDERMELEPRDEHDERDHRGKRVDEKKRVGAHADARATISSTISWADLPMSYAHARSSTEGSSSVSSVLSLRDAGMQWPRRWASRSEIANRCPLRKMNRSSGAAARRMSR